MQGDLLRAALRPAFPHGLQRIVSDEAPVDKERACRPLGYRTSVIANPEKHIFPFWPIFDGEIDFRYFFVVLLAVLNRFSDSRDMFIVRSSYHGYANPWDAFRIVFFIIIMAVHSDALVKKAVVNWSPNAKP